MNKSKFRKVSNLALINLGVLCALLLVVELCAGYWFRPISINNMLILHGIKFRYNTSEIYSSPTNEAFYTRDKFGLRGIYSSPDKIDIVTIGGSTTDERYITDGLTFQDRLAQNFKAAGRTISVVNAGTDGQSTHGHLKNFDHWFNFIPNFKPKFYLYYVGINDFYLPAGYGLDSTKDINSDQFEGRFVTGLKQEIKNRSALYNLFVIVRGMVWALESKVYHGHDKPDGFKYLKIKFPLPSLTTDEKARLADYQARLQALFSRTLKFTPSAKLICVTQSGIGLWKKDKEGVLWSRDPSEYPMRMAMNSALLEACAKHGGIGIDLANEIAFEAEDFYDSIHNTPSGAQRIGDFLFEKLKDRI